jgi:hypothetical protein
MSVVGRQGGGSANANGWWLPEGRGGAVPRAEGRVAGRQGGGSAGPKGWWLPEGGAEPFRVPKAGLPEGRGQGGAASLLANGYRTGNSSPSLSGDL